MGVTAMAMALRRRVKKAGGEGLSILALYVQSASTVISGRAGGENTHTYSHTKTTTTPEVKEAEETTC